MQRSLSGRSGIENGKNCRNMQKLIPQEFPVKKDLAPLWDEKDPSCVCIFLRFFFLEFLQLFFPFLFDTRIVFRPAPADIRIPDFHQLL